MRSAAGLGADGVLRVITAGTAGRRCPRPVARRRPTRRLVHGLPQRRRFSGPDVATGSGFATICGPAVASTGMNSWSPPGRPHRLLVHHVDGIAPMSPSRWARSTCWAWRRHRRRRRRLTGLAVDVRQPAPGRLVPDLTPWPTWPALDVGAPVEFDREQFPDGVNVGSAHPCRGWLGVDAGTRAWCGRNTVLRHRDRGRHRRGPGRSGRLSRIPARPCSGQPGQHQITDPPVSCADRQSWWPPVSCPNSGGPTGPDAHDDGGDVISRVRTRYRRDTIEVPL